LTFRGRRAILPALMRRLGLCLLALLALPLAGCGNPCQDLGNRLCGCTGGGTSSDTCRQQISNLLKDHGVSGGDEAFCSAKLDTCNAPPVPADVKFCEWINTEAGKVACGLANPPAAASFQPDAP
jgi:hypothetical protein